MFLEQWLKIWGIIVFVCRITFFLILYFVLCIVAIVTLFKNWSVGAQILFSLGAPMALVWWSEKRRSNKLANSNRAPKRVSSRTEKHPRCERRSVREQATRKAVRRTEWVPASKSVSVGGRDIGGMVYVGTPPLQDNHGLDGYAFRRAKCGAYIDPSLPVPRGRIDKPGRFMPYWPGYSDIPTVCRAIYLDWLANGRSDPSW